jgi:putative membrane protein insertion efficiency factor
MSRRNPLAWALLAAIRGYRIAISPLRPPSCRFTPTCSAYAVEAIELHGAGRGSWLALRRLLRCHPFHAGGHDPVPPPVAPSGTRPPTSCRPARPAA